MNLYDTLNSFYYSASLHDLKLMNAGQGYPNITYNSMLYLDLISYTPNCTASHIAEVLHISKPAVTIKLNELIKQGLVVKTQSEADRRVFYLSLSDKTAEFYAVYDAGSRRAEQVLKGKYSAAQIELFCEMLETVKLSYIKGE